MLFFSLPGAVSARGFSAHGGACPPRAHELRPHTLHEADLPPQRMAPSTRAEVPQPTGRPLFGAPYEPCGTGQRSARAVCQRPGPNARPGAVKPFLAQAGADITGHLLLPRRTCACLLYLSLRAKAVPELGRAVGKPHAGGANPCMRRDLWAGFGPVFPAPLPGANIHNVAKTRLGFRRFGRAGL